MVYIIRHARPDLGPCVAQPRLVHTAPSRLDDPAPANQSSTRPASRKLRSAGPATV